MKERTITIHGRVLYYCTQFRAYIMPKRCKEERRVGGGTISPRVREGKKLRIADAEVLQDLDSITVQRRACLTCPGVCKRSAAEKRKGELS